MCVEPRSIDIGMKRHEKQEFKKHIWDREITVLVFSAMFCGFEKWRDGWDKGCVDAYPASNNITLP